MPGVQVFSYANLASEGTRGTAVPPTRQLYPELTGILEFDNAQNFHEDENAGVRTRIRRVTRQSEDVNLALTIPSVAYDELVIPFSFLNGTATGVGGAADKTWTQTPSMTATNNPKSYTFDVGDDTQNYRCDYVMARSFKLAAEKGGMTSLEMDMFAQQAAKTAKANPVINSAVKIPADLWTIKFAATLAGLPGASISTNFLQSWELEILTGLRWRHYLDGNLFGAQHVETDIAGTITLTVESTALAVSEFYDKAVADTMDFIRLKATGPTLGGTNYSAQIDLPVLYEEPEPIAEEEDGINMYTVVGHLAYDATSAGSVVPVTVNSLAALP